MHLLKTHIKISSKSITLLTLFIIIVLQSCQKNKDVKTTEISIVSTDSIAKNLFEQKCNVCHNGMNKTEKEIIAPPFYAVRNQYLKFSMDKADFISTMKDWVEKPDSTKSLMRPAVKRFGVMPYQKFDEKEIDLILEYLYKTEQPKPDWFDTHQEMHRKGIEH